MGNDHAQGERERERDEAGDAAGAVGAAHRVQRTPRAGGPRTHRPSHAGAHPAQPNRACRRFQIQKNLEEYLEAKRTAFPRFYFLSNEELLEILVQAKNPLAVQPHMGKCFDGIRALDFGDTGAAEQKGGALPIFGMVSGEGEVVSLGKNVRTRGLVEQWLGEVEAAMMSSLGACAKAAVLDYEGRERHEWVLDHPAQIIIMVSQIFWCRGIVEVFGTKDPAAQMQV